MPRNFGLARREPPLEGDITRQGFAWLILGHIVLLIVIAAAAYGGL